MHNERNGATVCVITAAVTTIRQQTWTRISIGVWHELDEHTMKASKVSKSLGAFDIWREESDGRSGFT